MDIKIIEASPTETETLEKRDAEVQKLEGANDGEINQIAVKQVLEVEGSEYDSEIKTLIEWAKEKTGSSEYADLKWAIRELSLKIGTPTHGDRVKNLARFAYLELEGNRIEQEKKSFH